MSAALRMRAFKAATFRRHALRQMELDIGPCRIRRTF
jgi:hypothetical protein